MDLIRQYLIKIISAALICAVVNSFVGKKGALTAALKLLSGLFMAFTVISPLVSVRIQDFTNYLDELSVDSSQCVTAGETMAESTLAGIIKTKTEAYILDKAENYGAVLYVEVNVDGSDLPVPSTVSIKGNISPFGRAQLEKIIADELGIALEDQTWIG